MSSVNGAAQRSTYRSLKSILCADVSGYSKLSEANEQQTHINLCVRLSLVSRLIDHHHGVILRTEGDCVFASFDAIADALQCAIEIQATSSEQNETLDEDTCLRFRIGINSGEVMIDKGEAFGNCVNIAKRLESLAKPGEILFPESIFNLVEQSLPFNYEYLGKQRLKNIKKPLKVYKISTENSHSNKYLISSLKHKALGLMKPTFAIAAGAMIALVALPVLNGNHSKKESLVFQSGAISNINVNHDKKIVDTLETATEDLLNSRLVSPLGNNAVEKYNQILALDTNNIRASQGLQQIHNFFISKAEQELTKNNLEQAEIFLEKSEKVLINQPKSNWVRIKIIEKKYQQGIQRYKDREKENSDRYLTQLKKLEQLVKKNDELVKQQHALNRHLIKLETNLNYKDLVIQEHIQDYQSLRNENTKLVAQVEDQLSQQSLNTYESFYTNYQPTQQLLGTIKNSNDSFSIEEEEKGIHCSTNSSNNNLNPYANHKSNNTKSAEFNCVSLNKSDLHCSTYSNKNVKPHSNIVSKETVTEELKCTALNTRDGPIPKNLYAEPQNSQKKSNVREKKVVIYAYIPQMPHLTTRNINEINKNIVEVYKEALSGSALESFNTNFVLLSPPSYTKNFSQLDNANCKEHTADYVTSVRYSPSHSKPHSSALVIFDCKSELTVQRDTRYLLSDTWNEHGGIYLTPSTQDSFNVQVHSVVELALNTFLKTEIDL